MPQAFRRTGGRQRRVYSTTRGLCYAISGQVTYKTYLKSKQCRGPLNPYLRTIRATASRINKTCAAGEAPAESRKSRLL